MPIDPRAWARLPLSTLTLGTVVFAISVAVIAVLAQGTQAQQLLATPAKPPAPFVFDGSAPLAAVDLAAIQSQPLVHVSRNFYQKPVEAAPAAPPRPDYRLAGAMILPGKTPVAVVVSRVGNESKRVKPGDELAGWRVATVDRKQVVLTWGSERAEITPGAPGLSSAAITQTGGTGGLKRVPIVRQRVSAVGAGVQSLSAKGSSPSSGGTYTEQPRLYRPPPQ
jgi:hypothetical protein